jgi:hypothetical protein
VNTPTALERRVPPNLETETKMTIEKPFCYILWVIPTTQGIQEMRAICTERKIANQMRKMLLDSDIDRDMILKAWIEPLVMNHCFGNSMLVDMINTDLAKKLIEAGINKFEDKKDPIL